MKYEKEFLDLLSRSVAESIDRSSIVHLVREIVPDYSETHNNSVPKSVDVPRLDTAKKIVFDMAKMNMLIPFLNVFFSIHFKGYKGRKYRISRLRNLIIQLYDMGFSLDTQTGLLFEDPQFRISRNWGVLQEGRTYAFSFLWCDVVRSSLHVEENSDINIRTFYETYNNTVRQSVESRNGRIWHIEGDGILAAFHFGDYMEKCVYAAVEILHRMFNYNRFNNSLARPVQVRLSCNKGIYDYSENHEDIKKSEQIMNTIHAENHTQPDSVTVNANLSSSLGGVLPHLLESRKIDGYGTADVYSIRWDT
ncbi:MAG: hypothetical protein ACOCWH_06415 [Spirochaetota bacterium]